MNDKVDHSPVTLGGGSYDMNELQKLTDKAAKASADERAKLLGEGLEAIRQDDRKEISSSSQAGFINKTVTREIAEGIEVTETISVFDHKEAEKAEAEADAKEAKVAPAGKPAASEGSK